MSLTLVAVIPFMCLISQWLETIEWRKTLKLFSGNWSNNAEEHTSWAIAEEEPELPKGDSRIPKEMARVVEPSFSIIYFSQTSEIHFWIQMAEKGSKLNYKTYTLSACRQWEKGSKKVWQKKGQNMGVQNKSVRGAPSFHIST